jgi:hypothetical protein
MLCNTALRSGGSASGSPFINSDILYFVIVFLFGASNGYVIVVLLRWTMYHSLLVGSAKTVFLRQQMDILSQHDHRVLAFT